jgi:hypothetical protein
MRRRLDAMGQLTGGVAHDFNNLLMIVTGAVDIILRSPGNAQRSRNSPALPLTPVPVDKS